MRSIISKVFSTNTDMIEKYELDDRVLHVFLRESGLPIPAFLSKSEVCFSTYLPAQPLGPVFELVLGCGIFSLLYTCTHAYELTSQRNFQIYPLSRTASMLPLGHHTNPHYFPERVDCCMYSSVYAHTCRLMATRGLELSPCMKRVRVGVH